MIRVVIKDDHEVIMPVIGASSQGFTEVRKVG